VDLQLQGKKAIVSGGSRGIGKAIAFQLAREGADVAIGARSDGPLQETVKEIAAATGRKIVGHTVNTLDLESIKAFVKQSADDLGGADIVINSAARVGGAAGDIEAIDEAEILRDFEEKAIGYLRVAREAIPYMKQNGWGRIINISGLAGRRPGTAMSGAARNASTVAMTKAWANALGKYGINVVAIYPGQTVTEATYTRLEDQAKAQNTTVDALKADMDSKALLGHVTTAEEIGYVAAFLCSPLAVGITGEAISVSGGQGEDIHY
jgi:NAD(P)-dependent dehydrogenase (short-subunit alcohol dehydrogenase family)